MKDSELSRMFFHWAKAKVQEEIKRLKEEFGRMKGQRTVPIRKKERLKIESMACEPEKVLLRYRYVLGYRWEDIGKKMHYSESGVLKLHGQALKNFQIFKRVQ